MALHKLKAALAIATLCWLAPIRAGAMEFSLAPLAVSGNCDAHCPMAILAEGEIGKDTPEAFIAFAKEHARSGDVRRIVLLNSEGGRVWASIELGRIFRKMGVATIVASATLGSDNHFHLARGHCFSACVYALMGGRKRMVPESSVVGLHRMSAAGLAVDPAGGLALRRFDDGDMRNELLAYSSAMGVSRELVITAESMPPDTIHILGPQEIRRWRLGSTRF